MPARTDSGSPDNRSAAVDISMQLSKNESRPDSGPREETPGNEKTSGTGPPSEKLPAEPPGDLQSRIVAQWWR